MPTRGRIDLRLASRVLLLQLVLVTLTLIVAFGLFAEFNRHRLDLQYGVHAMDIARVVASSPTVLNNIGRYEDIRLNPTVTAPSALVNELETGPLQSVASRVEQRTHVLFVVTNTQGIRLAHPHRDELGLRVSTDPSKALSGQEEVVHQSGTLGR